MDILSIIAPIIALIGVGWLVLRIGLVTSKTEEGLQEYVFMIAVPALIIMTVTRDMPLDEIPWGYLVAYFTGVAVAWGLTMLFAQRILGYRWTRSVLCGFASSQSNTVLLGVPLILHVYGDAASLPMFVLMAVHLPIMMTAVALLAEFERDPDAPPSHPLRRVGRGLLRNRVLIVMSLGLVLRALHVVPSGIVATLLDSIGKTTSTCALLAMGMSLGRFRLFTSLGPGLMLSTVKLVVHPFAVWVVAFKILALPALFGSVAVLYAALPAGVNSFVLARQYQAGEAEASATIILSSLVSVFTIVAWLHFLGV